MFGYVRYDLPNLFVKDLMLYKAMYCGLCKGIAASCGQAARVGLTYDVTFLSVLLHNMTGTDVKVEELGALNTVLCYFKLTDDVQDGGKGRGRRVWFKKGYKRAKKKYPELVSLIENYMARQAETERKKTASPDMAADPSACLMRELSAYFLKEKAGEGSSQLFYAIGKWVYLIDALDDYDKDVKKKQYNPFVLGYGAKSRAELMQASGQEIAFLFDTMFFDMREGLGKIKFYFNRDLTDNVILRGLPAETARVMKGEKPKKMSEKI